MTNFVSTTLLALADSYDVLSHTPSWREGVKNAYRENASRIHKLAIAVSDSVVTPEDALAQVQDLIMPE